MHFLKITSSPWLVQQRASQEQASNPPVKGRITEKLLKF